MITHKEQRTSIQFSLSSKTQIDLDALNFIASGRETIFCKTCYIAEEDKQILRYQVNLTETGSTTMRLRIFENAVEMLSAYLAVIKAVQRNNLFLENVKWDLKLISHDDNGYSFIYLPITEIKDKGIKRLLIKRISELRNRDPRIAELLKAVKGSTSEEECLAALERFVQDYAQHSSGSNEEARIAGSDAEGETTALNTEGETTALNTDGETSVLSPWRAEECAEIADEGSEETTFLSNYAIECEGTMEKSALEGETTLLTSPANDGQGAADAAWNGEGLFLRCNSTGERIPIRGSFFLIGKDAEKMDYVVDNDSVSRHHATITCEKNTYYIMDNKSTNGTTIEGVLLQPFEKAELYNGAILSLGSETFQVQTE